MNFTKLTPQRRYPNQPIYYDETRTHPLHLPNPPHPVLRLVSPAERSAPNLLVFDTNRLLYYMDDTLCRVNDIRHSRKDTSILVPREVLLELDRLKRSRDETTSFNVSLVNVARGCVLSSVESWEDDAMLTVLFLGVSMNK